MSLWTPGGEHQVPATRRRPRPTGELGDEPGGIDPDDLSDEERARLEAMAEEMAEVRQQLLRCRRRRSSPTTPWASTSWPPSTSPASRPTSPRAGWPSTPWAAWSRTCEGRLGENEPVLRDALAQLRLAFVQLQAAAGEGTGPTTGQLTASGARGRRPPSGPGGRRRPRSAPRCRPRWCGCRRRSRCSGTGTPCRRRR